MKCPYCDDELIRHQNGEDWCYWCRVSWDRRILEFEDNRILIMTWVDFYKDRNCIPNGILLVKREKRI